MSPTTPPPPQSCINYYFEMLLGELHIPKTKTITYAKLFLRKGNVRQSVL